MKKRGDVFFSKHAIENSVSVIFDGVLGPLESGVLKNSMRQGFGLWKGAIFSKSLSRVRQRNEVGQIDAL